MVVDLDLVDEDKRVCPVLHPVAGNYAQCKIEGSSEKWSDR